MIRPSISTVVVGTDGSADALAAVRWAAGEAGRRGSELVILHAYDEKWIADEHLPDSGFVDIAASRAAEILADAELAARAIAPDLTVRRVEDAGEPVAALLEASRSASLAVVGSRGHGGFAALLLGGVGHAVATHARCPVVVVRGEHRSAAAPVVAGVDGSPSGAIALDLAFRQAQAAGCRLEAVRAFLRPAPPWVADIAPSVLWLEEGIAEEKAVLAQLVAPFRKLYPQVEVEELVDRSDAAHALLAASQRARLVVVGSRGMGLIRGTVMGSVGLRLLNHADCPVLIARHGDQAGHSPSR
jgi:nucleotide-binding universal stress UspA family protein